MGCATCRRRRAAPRGAVGDGGRRCGPPRSAGRLGAGGGRSGRAGPCGLAGSSWWPWTWSALGSLALRRRPRDGEEDGRLVTLPFCLLGRGDAWAERQGALALLREAVLLGVARVGQDAEVGVEPREVVLPVVLLLRRVV